MDAASTAFSKILHKGTKKENESGPGSSSGSAGAGAAGTGMGAKEAASIERETAPAVQHETVQKKHMQREQKVVDRERHQDHYKTTVQPLQEREVMPERHMYEQADVQERHINNERERDARTMLERKQAQFKDTRAEYGTRGETVQEPTVTSERTMHHLHETIQPVVEKETVMPSVTHKKIPVKETVQDPSLDEGVTINPPMSREEFEARMRK
ncbi:hypothetical protein GGR51DRAFT_72293 [Nemania sp. FL0031]|nr:hypothetical protein GGR51DRAFT_72293 [Nemania sp. FL0031]